MHNNKGRNLLLLTLFLGLSFGIFFNMATDANATPELSPDGKTCTPCHTDGRTGAAATGKPTEQPQSPVEQTRPKTPIL